MSIRRRRFLIGMAGAAAGTALPACRRSEETPPEKTPKASAAGAVSPDAPPADAPLPVPPESLTFLTAAEALTLEAVLERMLPADPALRIPGAREARVLAYVDRQLADPYFAGYGKLVRDGLKRLDGEARRTGAESFARLPVAQQDGILRAWQSERYVSGRYPKAELFRIVHVFALEGFWGDPQHGGNHQKVAWKWVDFDPGCPTPSGHCGDH